VIKFVSDLRQDGGFLRVLPVSPANKTDRHVILVTEILLKVVINIITQSPNTNVLYLYVKYFPSLFLKLTN